MARAPTPRVGVLAVTPGFLALPWTSHDLSALDRNGHLHSYVLPVWHKVSAANVRSRSLLLAERVGISTRHGYSQVTTRLKNYISRVLQGEPPEEAGILRLTDQPRCPRCHNLTIHIHGGSFYCDGGCGLTFDYY